MAGAACTRRIDVVLQMGLGRRHGRDGTAWTLANLAGSCPARIAGAWTRQFRSPLDHRDPV